MSAPLARLAARGTLWLGLVNVLSKGAQVLVILALGNYLDARQLGVVTITITLVNLAQVVQMMGVFDVVSRTEHPPQEFAGSVAALSVGAATVLSGALAVAATPLATLIGAPDAGPLLRVAGLSLPFSAYFGVQAAYLHRTLDFRRRLLPDAGSALVGAAVTIVSSMLGAGEWSLVAGVLTTAVLAPLLGLVSGVRLGLRLDREHVRETLGWVVITGPGAIIGVLLLQVDYVVVTRALGAAANGIYSFAYRIAFVPYITVGVVVGAVAFPVLARLAAGPVEDISSAFVRFWHVLLAVNTGLYAVLFLLADRIVVIDPRWAQSAPLLRILCGYGLLMSLLIVAHDAVRAIGRPGAYLRAMILHLVLLVVGAVAAVRWAGSAGVAWAQVGAAAVTLVVVTVVLARAGVVTGAVLGALRGPGVATAAVVAGQLLADRAGLLPAVDSLGGVLVLGPLLGVWYMAVLAVVDRAALADLRVALSRDRSAADG